jgi:hypothetical protein
VNLPTVRVANWSDSIDASLRIVGLFSICDRREVGTWAHYAGHLPCLVHAKGEA